MNILIADDHSVVRQGLKQILADGFPKAKFGEAQTAQETLVQVWKKDWDALVLDVTMPGRSGLDILREVKQADPKLPVLVLSIHPEGQLAVRALKAGASGYMTKGSTPRELVGAIKQLLAGNRYISPSLANKLASNLVEGTEKAPHESLSDREYEVMRMLAAGLTVKEIAAELSLSIKTVATYRMRVFVKMKVNRDAELVRYAVQNEIL